MAYKGQAHVLFDSQERRLPGQVAGHVPTGKEAPWGPSDGWRAPWAAFRGGPGTDARVSLSLTPHRPSKDNTYSLSMYISDLSH